MLPIPPARQRSMAMFSMHGFQQRFRRKVRRNVWDHLREFQAHNLPGLVLKSTRRTIVYVIDRNVLTRPPAAMARYCVVVGYYLFVNTFQGAAVVETLMGLIRPRYWRSGLTATPILPRTWVVLSNLSSKPWNRFVVFGRTCRTAVSSLYLSALTKLYATNRQSICDGEGYIVDSNEIVGMCCYCQAPACVDCCILSLDLGYTRTLARLVVLRFETWDST